MCHRQKCKKLLASPRIELGVRDYETLVLPLHQEAFDVNPKVLNNMFQLLVGLDRYLVPRQAQTIIIQLQNGLMTLIQCDNTNRQSGFELVSLILLKAFCVALSVIHVETCTRAQKYEWMGTLTVFLSDYDHSEQVYFNFVRPAS